MDIILKTYNMTKLELELWVGSGGDDNDDIDLQNGNMYYLKPPYGLSITNQINTIINVEDISFLSNNKFYNPNNNTSTILNVNISKNVLILTLQLLQNFIQELQYVVNFNQIVAENEFDDRQLNITSLMKAIYCIWFNFNSDLISDNLSSNTINMNNIGSHNYINRAYEDYMMFYNDDKDDNFVDDIRYIHPLLFPKIFELVFTNNYVPMSVFEKKIDMDNIDMDNYNNEITRHNLQYIQNQDTVLYIYRNYQNMNL